MRDDEELTRILSERGARNVSSARRTWTPACQQTGPRSLAGRVVVHHKWTGSSGLLKIRGS
jgi:hypothetical protein